MNNIASKKRVLSHHLLPSFQNPNISQKECENLTPFYSLHKKQYIDNIFVYIQTILTLHVFLCLLDVQSKDRALLP